MRILTFPMSIYMRLVAVVRDAFRPSDLTVRECPICGSLVLNDKMHEQWHNRLQGCINVMGALQD